MGRLLGFSPGPPGVIQRKADSERGQNPSTGSSLSISQPGDPLEREADQVADQPAVVGLDGPAERGGVAMAAAALAVTGRMV